MLHGPTHGPLPNHYLQSVDLALLLILMLRERGSLTVSGVSRQLGIAESTAHRSLAMLAYRGFATRNESRAYLPGPSLSNSNLEPGAGAELIAACRSHMEAISAETSESVNLLVSMGNKIHFLYTVEGRKPLRVGYRQGHSMPAEQNSGGLAMLSELSQGDLRALYPSLEEDVFTELRRTLRRVRARGYAINNGLFEHDVSAIGACLSNDLGDTLGALTVAIPTSRFRSVRLECTESLMKHSRDLNRRLQSFRPPVSDR
ncbi:IclR family transcriptional regulator [Corynebacterium sp. S7]